MFAHRIVSWTMEQSGCIFSVTISGFPVLDSAIGNGFLMLLWALTKLYIPHMPKFCMPTFGNGRNNTKTECICLFIVSNFQHVLGNPALFLAPTYTGRGPTGSRVRLRNRGRLENRSHVVPKTGFQDGGVRTRIFTHKIIILT